MDDKSERKTIDRLKGLQVVFRVYTCIKSKLVDEEYSLLYISAVDEECIACNFVQLLLCV